MEAPNAPVEIDAVLQQKTVRDASSRALFLTAIRECGKDGAEFTLARLQALKIGRAHV